MEDIAERKRGREREGGRERHRDRHRHRDIRDLTNKNEQKTPLRDTTLTREKKRYKLVIEQYILKYETTLNNTYGTIDYLKISID